MTPGLGPGRRDERRAGMRPRPITSTSPLRELLVYDGDDEALARRASEPADECALRGYDPVHLASALALRPGETILATSDRELSSAAVSAGLAFAPAL
jgi:hypothetical protein